MSLKVAIPLFGAEVAPRFCFTAQMLVACIHRNRVIDEELLDVEGLRWSQRLEALAELDVKVLLCGGFNRRFLPFARELGIPCVNGIVDAMNLLEDGDFVTIDGHLGIVTVGPPEFDIELEVTSDGKN